MSKIALSGPAGGTATYTVTAPTGATDRVITLPDQTATLITDSAGVLNIGSGQLYKDASGNVGIGTSSPGTKLTINQGSTGTYFRANASTSDRPLTLTSSTTTNNGDTHTLNIDSGTGIFNIAIDGSTRARIDSSGNLLVGTTTAGGKIAVYSSTAVDNIKSDSGSAAGTGWTHFNGTSSNNGTQNIKIYGNGNIQNANNSYGSLSDEKLKENIVDATPKLEKLNQVRVVNFNLKGDYEQHKQIGVIAQELEQIFPGMVEETPDRDAEGNDLGTTTKSVKYSVFVPMLVKAIQEQQAIITALTARVEALEGTQP